MHTHTRSRSLTLKSPPPGQLGGVLRGWGARTGLARTGTQRQRLGIFVVVAVVLWMIIVVGSPLDGWSAEDDALVAAAAAGGSGGASAGEKKVVHGAGFGGGGKTGKEDLSIPLSDTKSLSERFLQWSGGKPLTVEHVPLPDTGRIPDRLFLVWKSKLLGQRARHFLDNFKAHEPHLEVTLIDDAECAVLAGFYPGLKANYEALPLDVMRADICRVLAVYYFGGMYKDLDIDWRRPLAEWLDPAAPVVYGWEDHEHLCQWFFAARPGNPCLRNILQQITNLIADTSAVDFNVNIEAVIDITGPGVWTDAMQGCPTRPQFNFSYMRHINMHHDYAAAKWVGASTNGRDTKATVDPTANEDGYVSWLEERKKNAGWSSMWQNFDLKQVATEDSANALAAFDDSLPPIHVTLVEQSSVFLGSCELLGPRNAFDGLLDSGAVTTEDEFARVEMTFAEPLTMGTLYAELATPEERARTISAVRFFNRQRELATWNDWFPYTVQFFNASDHLVHELHKDGHPAPHYTFYLGGFPTQFTRMRFIRREGGAVGVNEIQFFMLPTFGKARRLVIDEFRAPCMAEARLPLYVLATNVTRRCASTSGFSGDRDWQYVMCGKPSEVFMPVASAASHPTIMGNGTVPPPKCHAYLVTVHRRGQGEVNSAFLMTLAQHGCTFDTVGEFPLEPTSRPAINKAGVRMGVHHKTTWCQGRGGKCDIGAELKATLNGATEATLAYLDLTDMDWQFSEQSFVAVMRELRAETLLLPLRMTTNAFASPAVVANLEALLQLYDLYSFHVHVRPGLYFPVDGVIMPSELQLCFRRKPGM